MKKFVVALIAVLTLITALSFPVCAEEETLPPVPGETSGEPAANAPEEDAETETFTMSEFFNSRVLPALISCGSALFAGLAMLVPYLKTNGKYSRLQGIYTKLKDENETLQGLLNTTDVSKFKETLEKILNEDFKGALNKMQIDNSVVAGFEAKIAVLSAQVQALISGATNAWAQSASAVACLTAAPSETVIRQRDAEIKALEEYIREQKGEEADAIIENLKGGKENDESREVPVV